MSEKTGESLISQLRLASARRRLGAFLEQIEELQTSSFPHPDGLEALRSIKANFEARLLQLDLPATADSAVVDGVCTQTSLAVARWTTVLGFILRSTNVRNPFELHFPLKRLVRKVIADDAKLLVSSEWDFVPFTYPMTLDLLPNFVLVGAPAPESSNVLITPLAGHEIGHSAWRRYGYKDESEKALAIAIDEVLAEDVDATQRLLAELARANFNRADLVQSCLLQGVKQLEEIFCDFFGLYVFGSSYLYAFEYFLAPGGQGRSPSYPTAKARIDYLLEAANELGLKYGPELFGRWGDSTAVPGLAASVLDVTDQAVPRIVPRIRQMAFELLADKEIAPINEQSVQRVLRALYRHEPDGGGASLAEIITAGWIYVRDAGGLAADENKTEYQMVGELMLKSVEVSEFRLRLEENA